MVSNAGRLGVVYGGARKKPNGKVGNGSGHGLKFDFCPCCDRKGYYKVPRSYEHCRLCGLHRILLPGQDF